MIPTTLDQWTKEAIIDLLAVGHYETQYFDFKEMLPHKNDSAGKERLKATCCAFANSAGGFLVFGVKDASSSAAKDRLVGMASSVDFPEHFGNFPAACEPAVLWTPKNPPIHLESGHIVQVVHVPRSWTAPHCIDVSGGAKRFPKRTHKGTEDMSYEEIRLMFLQYYEKRIKLQLLRSELDAIRRTTLTLIVPPQELGKRPPVGEFSLAVLESVLADTYTILAEQGTLVEFLNTIRSLCRQVNQEMQRLGPLAYVPVVGNREHVLAELTRHIYVQCNQIRTTCDAATQLLDDFLSKA